MKYKLIKEYPGSPELGTIAERISKIKSNTSYYYGEGEKKYCIYDHHVEDNPEYWEKVNEYLWWVVFTKEEALFKTYTPYLIETYAYHKNDSRQYFKTKEEAEEFILDNKPCLSYNDVISHKTYLSNQLNEYTLKQLIKSRL
jgi:hypothetical protein